MVKAEAKDHGYLNILAILDIEPTSFLNLNMMVFDWKSKILRVRLAGPAAIYRIRVSYCASSQVYHDFRKEKYCAYSSGVFSPCFSGRLDTPSSSNRSNLIPEPDTGGLIGLKTAVEKTDPRHTLFQNRQDLLTMEAAPISAMERVPHCAITRWSSRWRRDKTVSTPI